MLEQTALDGRTPSGIALPSDSVYLLSKCVPKLAK